MSEPGPRPSPRPAAGEELRRDVQAAWDARLELGRDFESSIAAGLADRVEELAAYRTAELRQQAELQRTDVEAEKSSRTQRFVLGIVSVGAGIPITAISSSIADLSGLMVAWAGIVGVNAVHALASRPRRRPRRPR